MLVAENQEMADGPNSVSITAIRLEKYETCYAETATWFLVKSKMTLNSCYHWWLI